MCNKKDYIEVDEDQFLDLTGRLDEQFSFKFVNGEEWDLLGDEEFVIDWWPERRQEHEFYIGWSAFEFLLSGHSPLIDYLLGFEPLIKEDNYE